MSDEGLERIALAEADIIRRVNGKEGPIILEHYAGEDDHLGSENVFTGAFLTGGEVSKSTDGTLLFPTNDYIQLGYRFSFSSPSPELIREIKKRNQRDTIRVYKGPLLVSSYDLRVWNNEAFVATGHGCFGATGHKMQERIHMAVGEEEVQAMLASGSEHFRFYLEKERQDPTGARELLQRGALGRDPTTHFDRRLLHMYQLLDQEAPAALLELAERDYRESRNRILLELEESLQTARAVAGRVEKVERGAKTIGEIRTEDQGQIAPFISGSYDTVEAFFISMGDRERLRDLKRNLRARLEEAIDLGMHQRQERVEMGMPGRVIELPTYITSLCSMFKIDYS